MSNSTVLNAWSNAACFKHTFSEQRKANVFHWETQIIHSATFSSGRKSPRCEWQALAWCFSCFSQVRKVSWGDKKRRQIKQTVQSVQVERTASIWIKNLPCTFGRETLWMRCFYWCTPSTQNKERQQWNWLKLYLHISTYLCGNDDRL